MMNKRCFILILLTLTGLFLTMADDWKLCYIDGKFYDSKVIGSFKEGQIKSCSVLTDDNGHEIVAVRLNKDAVLTAGQKKLVLPPEAASDFVDVEKRLKNWNLYMNVMPTVLESFTLKMQPGKAFPKFELNDSLGNKIDNTILKDKVSVFNLWYTGCGPCCREMPQLSKIKDEFPEVNFYSVTFEDMETAMPRIRKNGFNWTPLFDDRTLCKYLEGYGFPLTIVVGCDGKVIESIRGAKPESHSRLRSILFSLR